MVETGEWTIQELLKYLLSVRSTLQPAEIEILRVTPAFFEESTLEQNSFQDGTLKKTPRLEASDLYEPLDVLRSLGLPIIDWRGKDGKLKWKHSSEEGTLKIIWPSILCTDNISSQVSVQSGFEAVSTNRCYSGHCCQGWTTRDSCPELLP
jgi:hypothetical protein